MRENRDRYGHYVLCVQCGYYLTDLEIAGLRRGLSLRERTALEGQIGTAARVLARR